MNKLCFYLIKIKCLVDFLKSMLTYENSDITLQKVLTNHITLSIHNDNH